MTNSSWNGFSIGSGSSWSIRAPISNRRIANKGNFTCSNFGGPVKKGYAYDLRYLDRIRVSGSIRSEHVRVSRIRPSIACIGFAMIAPAATLRSDHSRTRLNHRCNVKKNSISSRLKGVLRSNKEFQFYGRDEANSLSLYAFKNSSFRSSVSFTSRLSSSRG